METKIQDTNTAIGTELVVAKGTSLETIFKSEDAFALMIKKIEDETREEAKKLDATTKKGRDALVSLSAQVSKKKAQLDRDGKDLTAKQRAEIDLVNESRKTAEKRLSELRDETRKPVTDWEEAEEKRIADLKAAMDQFNLEHFTSNDAPEDIQAHVDLITAIEVDESWGEYEEVAAGARLHAIAKYERDHVHAVQRVADAAELEELRKLRAEQLVKDQAAEEAKAEAARAEAIRVHEAEVAAAEAEQEALRVKAEAERIEAIRLNEEAVAKAEAEFAEAQAERDRVAEEQRIEDERLAAIAAKEAEAQREIDHNLAVEVAAKAAAQAERDRIAKEMDDAAAELEKRQADEAHVASITSDIHGTIMDIMSAVREDPDAKAGTLATKLSEALVAGKIPHTKVTI